jgi:hypothetical protein
MLSPGILCCVALVRTDVPLKCQFSQESYGITSQKTAFFIPLYDWLNFYVLKLNHLRFVYSVTLHALRQYLFLFKFQNCHSTALEQRVTSKILDWPWHTILFKVSLLKHIMAFTILLSSLFRIPPTVSF